MRIRVLLLFCLIVFLLRIDAVAQDSSYIDLRGRAAFRPGDDDVWRSKYIDELEEWTFIPVPGPWEANGFPLLDGFAWYRIRFRIPASLRNDSLLLIMSAVDDADETFLNGVLVGKTGSFPPNVRSELRSLRVYPLPRFIREEHNLLAIRVYDKGDEGGITGRIFRIIRAEDISSVLDEIVDTPAPAASLYISNGVMVSAISADSGVVRWCRPRLYDRISQELFTENTLSNIQLTFGKKQQDATTPTEVNFLQASGIVRASYGNKAEVFWYHPANLRQRALIAAIRSRNSDTVTADIRFTFDRPAWSYRELSVERNGFTTIYHILVYNSCCTELAERDLQEVLDAGEAVFGLDAEISRWRTLYKNAQHLPDFFDASEQAVYTQALVSILQSVVREPGGASGQILAGLEPQSRAVCVPSDHLLAVQALAAAGVSSEAMSAIEYVHSAEHKHFIFFDVYGSERGIGYPYLVPPAPWDGSGNEWQWEKADQATLRFDGTAMYIEAIEALRKHDQDQTMAAGENFDDSAWVAKHWDVLSGMVADILMYQLDSTGLLQYDDSPWGSGISSLPSVYGSIHAVTALETASQYARLMHDDLKSFLYRDAARRSSERLHALLRSVMTANRADLLDTIELRVFHPLLCDAITYGLFSPNSEETEFIFDMIESSFGIDGEPLHYNARPDGDWYERQHRPQIALRLCRAYAVAGRLERAEALFRSVTALAVSHNNVLPELYDPLTGGLHGARPSITTSADYILTAEAIRMARMKKAEKKNKEAFYD